ncbi:MAG: hypothetical protein QG632_577 [Candidatus Dependentiae bacterium]|nr:hypothetical protein [Candidatus Dependentiae bacterium]
MLRQYFLAFLFFLTAVAPRIRANSEVSHPRVFDAAIITGISTGLAWLLLHPVEKNLARQHRSPDFKNIRLARRFLRLLSLSGLGLAGFIKLGMSQPASPRLDFSEAMAPRSITTDNSDAGSVGGWSTDSDISEFEEDIIGEDSEDKALNAGADANLGESILNTSVALTIREGGAAKPVVAAKSPYFKLIRPKTPPKRLLLFTRDKKKMSVEDETRAIRRLQDWHDGLLVTRAEYKKLQRLERKRGEGCEERKVME